MRQRKILKCDNGKLCIKYISFTEIIRIKTKSWKWSWSGL
jgi:hypothetical protein